VSNPNELERFYSFFITGSQEEHINIYKIIPNKMNSKKILLIVNDESTIESLSEYFENLGFKVFSAKSVITGLEVIRNLNPDMIFSDTGMPGLNGLELSYILKTLNYDIPIILISSFNNQGNKLIDKCSIDYVKKPIDTKCLSETISGIFAGNAIPCKDELILQ